MTSDRSPSNPERVCFRSDRTIEVNLWYPRSDDGEPNQVEIGLTDVRAAGNIRVRFDHERDGWVIGKRSVKYRIIGDTRGIISRELRELEPGVEIGDVRGDMTDLVEWAEVAFIAG